MSATAFCRATFEFAGPMSGDVERLLNPAANFAKETQESGV